jgi:hypothetical protein
MWSEKTTVCRIFNCQRSAGGNIAPRISSVASGRFPPDPLGSLHSLAASTARSVSLARTYQFTTQTPSTSPVGAESAVAPRVALRLTSRRFDPSARLGLWAPAEREAGGLTKLNKVENTGLEPVTSWLQTRRSPS